MRILLPPLGMRNCEVAGHLPSTPRAVLPVTSVLILCLRALRLGSANGREWKDLLLLALLDATTTPARHGEALCPAPENIRKTQLHMF